MKMITPETLQKLGFELVEKYPHDQFATRVYKKGYITVEVTFENNKQINSEVVMEGFLSMTAEELEIMTPILGKKR